MNNKIPIIYEDELIAAVDKPAGLIVGESRAVPERSILNYISDIIDLDESDEEFVSRRGLVHRLDRETSGVLLLARDLPTFKYMLKQFKKRRVNKEYICIVYGSFSNDAVQINAPIARNPRSRHKFAVVKDGRESSTRFEKIGEFELEEQIFSVVKAEPYTGRTHQIRVHLTALNHPVAGDYLYLGEKRRRESRQLFGRLMLHSHKISFIHPKTKENLTIVSDIPEEFSKYTNI